MATGTYAGLSPVAPGTVGTIWGIVIAFFLSGSTVYTQGLTTIAVIFFAIALSSQAVELFGEKDPPGIVCDEVAGVLVGFFLIPFSPFNALLVFLLFRFFDILKPYPANVIDERLKGGVSIVLDDCVAGVYTNICAFIVIWALGPTPIK